MDYCLEMLLCDAFGGSSLDDGFDLRFLVEVLNIFFLVDQQ